MTEINSEIVVVDKSKPIKSSATASELDELVRASFENTKEHDGRTSDSDNQPDRVENGKV